MCLFLHKFKPASHSCSIDKNMASHSSDRFLNWMDLVSLKEKKHKKKHNRSLKNTRDQKEAKTLNELNELYLTHHD